MTTEEFRELALSFPETVENPHFDRAAFKIVNRRIFATLHEKTGTANLKLSEIDQGVFCSLENNVIYPVPNKFGLQGWTTFDLKKVPKGLVLDALDIAHKEVFKSRPKNKARYKK